jgi:hypothetical protein
MTELTQTDSYVEAERKIRAELWQSLPLLLLTALIPILAFKSFLMPDEEDVAIWFQRAGSLMVVSSVWVEFKLFKIAADIYPSGVFSQDDTRLTEKYSVYFGVVKYLALAGALFGTVIWGYGDVFYKHIA